MISDQTIGSARAEENWNHAGRRVVENLLTALLALILVLASLSNLAAVEGLSPPTAERAGHTLPLPQIPHLESMPWMNGNASAPAMLIDTLILPDTPPWGDPRNPQVEIKASTALS